MPKVILTLDEQDYHSLLLNGALMDTKYSFKVLPETDSLKEDDTYKQLLKDYHKSSDKLNEYVFNKITNGKNN